MKKFKIYILLSVIVYAIAAVISGAAIQKVNAQKQYAYRVDINRFLSEIQEVEQIHKIDLEGYPHLVEVSFLLQAERDHAKIKAFYAHENKNSIHIEPVFLEDGFMGYLKFIYKTPVYNAHASFLMVQSTLIVMELLLLGILFHMKKSIMDPFQQLSALPMQLAKGHYKGDVKITKDSYYEELLWGIGQLKDSLDIAKKRELELLKEKKQFLLALSHDIKTPLNLIKLYTKALKEQVYRDQQSKDHGLFQINQKAIEIEGYVEQIIQSSREDIMELQVEIQEFYLSHLIKRMEDIYGEQCDNRNMELIIHAYEERLLYGDIDRSQEVLENLFENAFKYGDGKRIELSFGEEDYCLLIRFFSTGIPVQINEFNHLFDSFFRGANSRGQQGSGLGLYICKELMQKMGGAIYAEKAEDGMMFVCVFR